jgi:hypothetical protein
MLYNRQPTNILNHPIIEPLSSMTLKAAENLRDKVFKDDIEEIEKNLLLASLNPIKYKKVYLIYTLALLLK